MSSDYSAWAKTIKAPYGEKVSIVDLNLNAQMSFKDLKTPQ